MKIANDNPKLSFLLPFSVIPALFLSFLRKQESRVVACEQEKATTLDPRRLPGSISAGYYCRGQRRGQASRMTEGRDSLFLSSLRKQESRVVLLTNEGKRKDTGSRIKSGMTEGERARTV